MMTNIYIWMKPLWKVKGFFNRTSWKVCDVQIVRKTWVLSSFSVCASVSVCCVLCVVVVVVVVVVLEVGERLIEPSGPKFPLILLKLDSLIR